MESVNVKSILEKIYDHCDADYGRFGCMIWKGATFSGRYGRIRNPFARFHNQPSFVRTHRLVYLLHHIQEYSDLSLPHFDAHGHSIDVSHVCHNKLCVRFEHLTLETHMVNCSRSECVDDSHCSNIHNPACLI